MQKQLVLDTKTAKQIYPESGLALREILHASFGENTFAKKTFKEILTWEDVAEAAGVDKDDPFYNEGPIDDVYGRRCKLLPKVLNPDGWKANYEDTSQAKWRPYFWTNKPGFRFGASATTRMRLRAPAPGPTLLPAKFQTMLARHLPTGTGFGPCRNPNLSTFKKVI